jgi:hypothetical protein
VQYREFTRFTPQGIIMRKITADIQNAIRAGKSFSKANTPFDPSVGTVRFHGSTIAQNGITGWGFCFQGFATPTTRDRINAVRGALGLPLVGFIKGVPHVGGRAIGLHEWF